MSDRSDQSTAVYSGSYSRPDIIDLDRYMRRAVRPSITSHRRPTMQHSLSYPSHRELAAKRTREGGAGGDSTLVLSVQSRPTQCNKIPRSRRARRHHHSSPNESLLSFREQCEKTLKYQQNQLARITALCERLVAQPSAPAAPAAAHVAAPTPHSLPTRHSVPTRRARTYRSSLSSTSQTTHYDKQAQECKTYKIIMSKLDQLNKVFQNRVTVTSGSSISLRNKLVSTEPDKTLCCNLSDACGCSKGVECGSVYDANSTRRNSNRCIMRTIPLNSENRVTGSVPRNNKSVLTNCHYDLEDPVHLYIQSKKIRVESQTAATSARSTKAAQAAGEGGGEGLCRWCRTRWRSICRCLWDWRGT